MTRRAQIILLAASLFLVAPVSAQKPAPPIDFGASTAVRRESGAE
jgi:hypothetical protein